MPVNYEYIKYTVPAAIYLNKQTHNTLYTHIYISIKALNIILWNSCGVYTMS